MESDSLSEFARTSLNLSAAKDRVIAIGLDQGTVLNTVGVQRILSQCFAMYKTFNALWRLGRVQGSSTTLLFLPVSLPCLTCSFNRVRTVIKKTLKSPKISKIRF